MDAARAQRMLGKYKPIAELGRGGMATVYLASATGPAGFSKLVVVKEMLDEYANDPEFREMFLEEARLAARLNHPNIVLTNEIVEDDGRLMMVMEYLEGQSFAKVRHRFGKNKRLTLAHSVRLLVDLLDGLHAAHELCDYDGTPLNVVHRDISPHNVFVTYAGVVKLVDFGIAKAATSASSTRTGIVKGKVRYMAPEQAFGRAVDRRSDVFAVGVMLWEAVTGRRLWLNMPDAAVMHALATGEIPSVVEFAEAPPGDLANVCARALAQDPAARYATAAEMREDLLAWLEHSGVRTDARELGKLVTEGFEAERTQIRTVIDEQMKRAKTMSDSDFAEVALPRIGGDSGRLSTLTPMSGRRPAVGERDEDSVSSSVPSLSTPRSTSAAVMAPAPVEAPAAPRRKVERLALFVLAAIAFAAIGALAGVVLLRQPVAQVAPVGPAAQPPQALNAAPSPVAPVHLAPGAMTGTTDPSSAPVPPAAPVDPAVPAATSDAAIKAPAPVAPAYVAPKVGAKVAPQPVAAPPPSAPEPPPVVAPPPASAKTAKPTLEIRPAR